MTYKSYLLLFLFIIWGIPQTFGQSGYLIQIHQAEAAYRSNCYNKAALTYRQAFTNYPDSVTAINVYHSARAWSAAGNVDSAIIQLQSASITYKFNKYGMLMADQALIKLHGDKRWANILIEVERNMKASYTPLQRELQEIKDNDQHYRLQADSIRKVKGATPADIARVYKQIAIADSINLKKVKNILETRGWPHYSEIRDLYASLFLVIQHADLNTQIKYLPMIQEAEKNNDIDPESVAILEDRIAVRQGRKQLYGSQLNYQPTTHTYSVYPIEDEEHVNERRAKKGMIPLQDYLKHWNINYIPVK